MEMASALIKQAKKITIVTNKIPFSNVLGPLIGSTIQKAR